MLTPTPNPSTSPNLSLPLPRRCASSLPYPYPSPGEPYPYPPRRCASSLPYPYPHQASPTPTPRQAMRFIPTLSLPSPGEPPLPSPGDALHVREVAAPGRRVQARLRSIFARYLKKHALGLLRPRHGAPQPHPYPSPTPTPSYPYPHPTLVTPARTLTQGVGNLPFPEHDELLTTTW